MQKYFQIKLLLWHIHFLFMNSLLFSWAYTLQKSVRQNQIRFCLPLQPKKSAIIRLLFLRAEIQAGKVKELVLLLYNIAPEDLSYVFIWRKNKHDRKDAADHKELKLQKNTSVSMSRKG